ncbi:MAG: GNAT family N-acetyltransferase [Armatimonadota bacterium]|nr:GNAT family N-acetyltransferase [Armatimonadota bacterium]
MTDSLVQVRPIGADDFQAVSALLAELGRPAISDETRVEARQIYARHLARPNTASLLAEVGGTPVGFMSLEFRERLNQTTLQAWIPDLIVTASARGKGVGRALLERGFALARERGCWAVTLESGYARTVAHQFYRAAGMTDGGLYFALSLAP